jgi:hypothetical protein
LKDCCFCGAHNEDWRHVLTCNGTGAIIYRTGSWAELGRDLKKMANTLRHIWFSIKFGQQHFACHPDKDDNTHPRPPFGTSLRANHILLNNAITSYTIIGWHSLMKGRISKEWSKLWAKAMGPQLAITFERATIKARWNHSYRLCIFRNNEDHKNNNRPVAEYKQKELEDTIRQLHSSFIGNDLPYAEIQMAWAKTIHRYEGQHKCATAKGRLDNEVNRIVVHHTDKKEDTTIPALTYFAFTQTMPVDTTGKNRATRMKYVISS